MPLFPPSRFCQKTSRSLPSGVTTPMPVITTLRFIAKLLGDCDWTNGTGSGPAYLSPIRCDLSPPASTRPHADALHGLEELAFGLNRRRDNDLSLLKLGQVARAHITHAGRNRSDQILAAIVDFC